MSQKIRIAVIDDHPVVRFGLVAIINSQPNMTVVAEAENGLGVVEIFRNSAPDVTLIDLRMPEMSGVEAVKSVIEEFPHARFVALTTYKGDEDIYRALTAGVKGYLLKGMPPADLLDAIRSVHAGFRYLPDSVLQSLSKRIPNSELSSREMEILHLVITGQSNREIAQELGITESTVKWHVNLILDRLDVTNRTQAAIAAVQRGIIEL